MALIMGFWHIIDCGWWFEALDATRDYFLLSQEGNNLMSDGTCLPEAPLSQIFIVGGRRL